MEANVTLLKYWPFNALGFAFGGQDGTNVDAQSVRFNDFGENHYTTFGSAHRSAVKLKITTAFQ